MELFVNQLLAGLATGGIYALMALAIVMIYRASGHLNFAQGEMATCSAFFAWQMMQWGLPYWIAFIATISVSFAGGVTIERTLLRPLNRASAFAHVAVYIGLFAFLNSASGFIWDASIKSFPTPFGSRPLFGGLISTHNAGMLIVTLILIAGLGAFFRFSRSGLGLRAAVANPDAARLNGVRVEWMISLGWGIAAAIGAVAGMMIAPVVFLEPNMMVGILVYGFAAAIVGGLTHPAGAVIGGFLLGAAENLVGTYFPLLGRELKLPIALAMIVIVLLLKPGGLFGRPSIVRV